MKGRNLPNFIIGGTNKAGTTSVFRYLSDHPQVCGSKVKETAFFIRVPSNDIQSDICELSAYFQHCRPSQKVRVEASTGYLARADVVIPRIRAFLGSPKILFILRAPADRLLSYYNFHVSGQSIPASISFDHFVEISMHVDAGADSVEDMPFEKRHLLALQHGKYARNIKKYINAFGSDNVKVMLFDDLQRNSQNFMQALAEFLTIDPEFYSEYVFEIENVTFFSRRKWLYKLAELSNRKLEPILRQRPKLKSVLVRVYKVVNMEQTGYTRMSQSTHERLASYYSPDIDELENILAMSVPETWR